MADTTRAVSLYAAMVHNCRSAPWFFILATNSPICLQQD